MLRTTKLNDSLYGFAGRRAPSNVAERYNFSSVTLLRTIPQFTPFSVWRIKRTGNSLFSSQTNRQLPLGVNRNG
jgi:hypothetical protein